MLHRLYPVSAIALVTALAACGPQDDGYADEASSDEGGEAVSAMGAPRDFAVGLQASDDACSSQVGTRNFTDSTESTTDTWTHWTSDTNHYDPDCFRVTLKVGNPLTLDFRLKIQASDGHPGSHAGPVQYTPWASEGGGVSRFATDDNHYDPDYFRVGIETRPWPKGAPLPCISDFRVGLKAIDSNGGDARGREVFTPFAHEGGGTSSWAKDHNGYDPDGYTVRLEVK